MNEFRYDGRVAIVTGAGSNPGLGRAYARELAARGAKVVVNDLGVGPDGRGLLPVNATAVVAEIRSEGGEAVADGHSVAGEASARAIVQTALDTWGRVDILINNAGVCIASDFDELTPADAQLMVDVHLMGTLWMCRAAWAMMRDAGYGRIVNTTSGSMFGEPHLVIYGAAKAGIFGLTRGLALEGQPHGIRVNAVGPAAATNAAPYTFDFPPDMFTLFAEHSPPEAVSPVVAYLAHERCEVSGTLLQVASGSLAATRFGNTTGIHQPGLTVEDVSTNLASVFDGDLTLLDDPTDPNAANRDTDHRMVPKPYHPG